jgi:hypothetical protein
LPSRTCIAFLVWFIVLLAQTGRANGLDLKSDAGENSNSYVYGKDLGRWDFAKRFGAETVRDRDRAWAQPDGIRVGNFLVLPAIATGYAFDSNVFNTATDPQSDHIFQLQPTLRLRSMLPRHALDFAFRASVNRYARHSELNYTDLFGTMDGALHINHAHTLSLSLLSAFEAEDNFYSGAIIPAAERTKVWRNQAKIGLTRDAGRAYAKIGAAFERWDYGDVRGIDGSTIDQDFRDLRIYSSDLKLGYRFSPGFSFESRLRGLRRLQRGTAVLSTDAWGYEIIGGLKLQTSPLLKWELLAGFGHRDYDQPGLDNTNATLVQASATWLPTQNLTIYGTLNRGFNEDVTIDSVFNRIDTTAELVAEYEARRNLIFTIKGKYIDSDFLGSARKDRWAVANFQMHYLASKNWKVTVEYEYAVRHSNLSDDDVKRSRAMIQVKRQF